MSRRRLRTARKKAAPVTNPLTVEGVIADGRLQNAAIEIARMLHKDGVLDAFVVVVLLLTNRAMIDSARLLGQMVGGAPDTVDRSLADFGASGTTPLVMYAVPVTIAEGLTGVFERDHAATFSAGRREDMAVFFAARGGFRLLVIGDHGIACLRGPLCDIEEAS